MSPLILMKSYMISTQFYYYSEPRPQNDTDMLFLSYTFCIYVFLSN